MVWHSRTSRRASTPPISAGSISPPRWCRCSSCPSRSSSATYTANAACAPVPVVTTLQDGLPYGATVSAFMSLQLRPPMIAVAMNEHSILPARIKASWSSASASSHPCWRQTSPRANKIATSSKSRSRRSPTPGCSGSPCLSAPAATRPRARWGATA
ncbi:flavin reductase [Nocardia pseudovaccinii]|uniref:flavin reductase n=1 Tax=Nocardia pseudovaccinii TaxID=189540 RepID=UPI0027D900CC|nr:flavin reductase [Nocardia pseudovaccinii]